MNRLLEWDARALVGLRKLEHRAMTRLMKALTHLGDTSSWIFITLLLLAAGGEARRFGLIAGTAALLATLPAQVLKRLCRRSRPSEGLGGFSSLVENPDAWSFPSGHTAAAVAVAIGLAGTGAGIGVLFAVLALGIAVSRVYLGAHYPLDVLVGAAIGGLAGYLTHLAFLGLA